ncbi:protein crumbs homolog 2-like [Strongylocentrotus purpuratus]|uniref:Uncharacterized protein n=1 Tax=Strongylocentrotus purpuratus TaxID=7668 RepID=A0A7M7NP40_STRPU|nr:protein crumbs homolog 2-like [Strongylocentrotus purpuratus]
MGQVTIRTYDIDDCVGTLCLNGGTCMDDVNGFSCKCAPGYTGRTCNIDIDDCVGTLCLNGGTCMDDVNGFSCKCAPGYTGRTCIIEVKCGSPENGTNTESVSITEGYPGEPYNYTCSHGFTVDPNNLTVVCQLNTKGTIASWSLIPPTCSEVKCGSPGNGTNTESVSITEGYPGKPYNYTCSHGFTVDPNNLTIVCQLNTKGTIASWSLIPPTCSEVKCGLPGNGTNTKSVSITEGKPGEAYNYTCSHGFTVDPNNLTVVCQLNTKGTIASWSLIPPTCSEPTAKIFVTDEGSQNKIFVADLQDDLNFTDIPSTKEPRYITYDSVEKKIHWTDKETKRVYRADVDGGNRENVTFESSDELRGIAIAETSRTLYIANKSPRKITSVSIAKGTSFPRSEKDFVTGITEDLYSLEVDEEEGFLYWSMQTKIRRKPFNGSGQTETIYSNKWLAKITGLSIDLSRDPPLIFACDYEKTRTFYKAANTKNTENELAYLMDDPDISGSEEEQELLRDISYFNGSLYWTKDGSHKGIAVLTNYDSVSVSFQVKEADVISKPFQLLIIDVNLM